MVGVEFDFVVTDCIKALEQYEGIFDVERIEVTAYDQGFNEAIFSIYGVRFHMLDMNPEYGLLAPDGDRPNSFWVNLMVEDIQATWQKAMDAGCTEIQAVSELPAFGVANAVFMDSFGYAWMLHQIKREVSFEDRMKLFEEELKDKP